MTAGVVTGATGFLGREIVRSLVRHGATQVRCLVRPGTAPDRISATAAAAAGAELEIVPCRLDDPGGLRAALDGAGVLYHAAAAKKGPPAALVAGTVTASERVFRAALAASVSRVVLVGSFGAMGVAALPRGAVVDEEAPLDPHPELRDPYSFAKHRQEALAWRLAREEGLPLAVIRPGFIVGPGAEILGARIGLRLPGLFLHLGGGGQVPLTFVENCADAVVLAGAAPGALGRALCVVDDDLPTSRALLARYRREVEPLPAVTIPYPVLLQLARLNAWYSARTEGHLPPVLSPYKVASLWKPHRYSNRRAKEVLGWAPRVTMGEALDRTFEALARRPEAAPAPAGRSAGRPARASA
jgi:nucleoside-diphosphate-sugar epimerase